MQYQVVIEKTLKRKMVVEASSRDEAKAIAIAASDEDACVEVIEVIPVAVNGPV